MDRSAQITLVGETFTTDSIGQRIAAETTSTVFCQVDSVSQSEFFAAGQNGISPEYKVTVFSPEYSGQRIAILNGKRYGIYRTYLGKNERLELYLEAKASLPVAPAPSGGDS